MSSPAVGFTRWLAPAGVPFAWRQLCFDRNRLLAATCGIILAVTSILFQTGAYNALFAGRRHAIPRAECRPGDAQRRLQIRSCARAFFARPHCAGPRRSGGGKRGGVRAAVGLWRIPETGAIDQMLIFGVEPPRPLSSCRNCAKTRRWLTLPTTCSTTASRCRSSATSRGGWPRRAVSRGDQRASLRSARAFPARDFLHRQRPGHRAEGRLRPGFRRAARICGIARADPAPSWRPA